MMAQPFGQNQGFMDQYAQSPVGLKPGYVDGGGGFAYQVGGNDRYAYDPNATQGLSGSEQMQGAYMGDYGKSVAANQFNYDQRMQGIDEYQQAIMGGADQIAQSGIDAQAFLSEQAGHLSEKGQKQYDERQSQIDQVKQEQIDYSSQLASSAAMGERRALESQHDQNAAGIKLGDPQALANQQKLTSESSSRMAGTMAQLGAQFNQQRTSLGMAGVSAMNQAASTQQGFDSLASNMNQMGVQMNLSAQAQAANLSANGMGRVAEMISANPFSPVSFAQTLASFFQFTQTPGAKKFQGFSYPEMNFDANRF
tara:strand:- start:4984 stop:5913 length:930 start_codon:yes stop_codon:yes gene_type:complete